MGFGPDEGRQLVTGPVFVTRLINVEVVWASE